jgi:hypothetical protein
VNVRVLLVPSDVVVTLTFLAVSEAVVVIINVAVTVVSLTTVRLLYVTPEPDTVILVAPVRPLPVRVTGTLVPRVPELGAIVESTGPDTVNVWVLLVPPGVVTLTVLALIVAVAKIVNVAVTVVSFTTVRPLYVTPVPDTVIVVAPVKPLPESVTGTLVPLTPVAGVIEASVGAAGLTTVNVSVLLVPPGVVTLTVLALAVAVAEIVNVVVTVVELTTVTVPTVTPGPDTATVVPIGPKFVPVKVTGTAAPCWPLLGATEASVGPAGLTTVSVKLWTGFVPTPLLAVKVILYVAAVPAAGVPLNTYVEVLNETPLGSAPVSVILGVGIPVAVTGNDPATPTVNVVLLALVIAGAWVGVAKFAVTLSAAFIVMVVEALLELATLPVQLAKL